MAGDLLSTGVSGLLAFQRALATTSHNVSNVDTDGYSRQRTELSARQPQFTGFGYVGAGVMPVNVNRMVNEFVDAQLRTSTSSFQQFDTLHRLTSQLDSIVGDPASGLSQSLQGFFDAVEGVAADPADMAARDNLVAKAKTMAERFQYLDGQFRTTETQVNAEIRDTVGEINRLTGVIASTNQEIINATGGGNGAVPNDLLDRRDNYLTHLAEYTDIATIQGPNNTVTVTIGNGHAVVLGAKSQQVFASTDPNGTGNAVIAMENGANITATLTGGKIGGMTTFRDDTLVEGMNELGRLAIGLADAVNSQHQLGLDLDGLVGEEMFSAGGPRILSREGNPTNAIPSVAIDAANELKAIDYTLGFDGTTWRLTDAFNGKLVTMTGSGTDADPFLADGLSISVQSIGAGPADSYTYRIQPTRDGARSFEMLIDRADKLAAASPLRIERAATNGGNAEIEQPSVDNLNTVPLASFGGDITLQFDANALGAGVPGYVVTGGPGGTIAYDPVSESMGKDVQLGAPYDGARFRLSGVPVDGDEFTITDNTNAVGDNRNMLQLGELRDQPKIEGNRYDFQSAYAAMVASIGTDTQRAESNRQTHLDLKEITLSARDAVSGVNLDEEAANLLKYQQAYQASARVISVADSMFQEVLSLARG